jgi:hypothetical protein
MVDSAETVDAAFKAVKGKMIGRVTSLDEARQVMTRLGMTEAEQDDRIHFAMTGEVLSGG